MKNGLSDRLEALSIVARSPDDRGIVECSWHHRSILLLVISTASSLPGATTPLSSALPARSLGSGGGLARGWAHESEIDVDGLFEELLSIAALDRGLGLAHGRELDESVSLRPSSVPVSRIVPCAIKDALCSHNLSLSYLDVSRPAIQVDMDVLNLSKVAKQILQVLFRGFLVYVGHNDDPALDAADWYGVLGGLAVANGVASLVILVM